MIGPSGVSDKTVSDRAMPGGSITDVCTSTAPTCNHTSARQGKNVFVPHVCRENAGVCVCDEICICNYVCRHLCLSLLMSLPRCTLSLSLSCSKEDLCVVVEMFGEQQIENTVSSLGRMYSRRT